MHLLSCEHPQRVYNKYTNEYVWVTCGKCHSCKNARAMRWTDALERERLLHRYCFFVTLTYSDEHLPKLELGYFPAFNYCKRDFLVNNVVLQSNREYDGICIPFKDIDFEKSQPNEDLFFGLFKQFNGIPYASFSDIQYFHKRLNKFFFDNVTHKFKNFRYFTVSEFGSTTLRPHFHSIYYVDDKSVAIRFEEAIRVCWKHGITDCRYVENSACGYVAQYVNKFADLPLFYQKAPLAPKYVGSKHLGTENIGNTLSTGSVGSDDIQKIFDECLVETCHRRKANTNDFVVSPLHKSTENYLFPKCPFFKQVSDTCRIELYNISRRFAQRGFENFLRRVEDYVKCIYEHPVYSQFLLNTEFSDFLYNVWYLDWISDVEENVERAYGWMRRLYYLSKRIIKNACIFNVSLSTYVEKIIEYYNKKELYLLKKMYEFQETYVSNIDCCSDDLVLMYPEFIHASLNSTIGNILTDYTPADVRTQRIDAAHYYFSNKKTHFKNAYLDSLQYKKTYSSLQQILKTYFYAQKCNETLEAFAS